MGLTLNGVIKRRNKQTKAYRLLYQCEFPGFKTVIWLYKMSMGKAG